ncbi:MAG: hypothetical protein M1837_006428 [Sclerophora amabilis]|nr:MAG: hypothetical protein M1837_006428 [Sclerophora amabilis]
MEGSKVAYEHLTGLGLTQESPKASTLAPSPEFLFSPGDASPGNAPPRVLSGDVSHHSDISTGGEKQDGYGSLQSQSLSAPDAHGIGEITLDKAPSVPPSTPRNSRYHAPRNRELSTSSSRTSDGLSMCDGDSFNWDSPFTAGLRSPSKRKTQPKDQSKALPRSVSYNERIGESHVPINHDPIEDDGRVSLSTLGGHQSHKASGSFDRTKRSSSDQILLTPSSNPIRLSHINLDADGSPIRRSRNSGPRSSVGRQGSTFLLDISGNQGDSPMRPRQKHEEPSSPFKGEKEQKSGSANSAIQSPPPISALKGKGRQQGHKRQNCVRISNLVPMVIPPPKRSSVLEDPTKLAPIPQTPPSPTNSGEKKPRPLPRPPSTSGFDPEISPRYSKGNTKEGHDVLLPSLKSHQSRIPPPAANLSTNDRPILALKPGRNRFSTGSSILSEPIAAFSRPSTVTGVMSQAMSTEEKGGAPSAILAAVKEPGPSNAFTSPFDISPLRISTVQSRSPKRPARVIRGPRSPPSRRKTLHGSPSQDLCRSILALRRMNSEISVSRSDSGDRNRSSRHYLNLSDSTMSQQFARGAESFGSSRRMRPISLSTVDDFGSPNRRNVELSPELEARMKKGVGIGFRESKMKGFRMSTSPNRAVVGLGLSLGAKGDQEFYDEHGFLIA